MVPAMVLHQKMPVADAMHSLKSGNGEKGPKRRRGTNIARKAASTTVARTQAWNV